MYQNLCYKNEDLVDKIIKLPGYKYHHRREKVTLKGHGCTYSQVSMACHIMDLLSRGNFSRKGGHDKHTHRHDESNSLFLNSLKTKMHREI